MTDKLYNTAYAVEYLLDHLVADEQDPVKGRVDAEPFAALAFVTAFMSRHTFLGQPMLQVKFEGDNGEVSPSALAKLLGAAIQHKGVRAPALDSPPNVHRVHMCKPGSGGKGSRYKAVDAGYSRYRLFALPFGRFVADAPLPGAPSVGAAARSSLVSVGGGASNAGGASRPLPAGAGASVASAIGAAAPIPASASETKCREGGSECREGG